MARKSENLVARQEFILPRLQEAGTIAIDELCTALNASLATIRIDPLFYEPFRHDASFQDKVSSFAEEKRRIARTAAELVQTGNTVALTGGTTTTEVVRSLKRLSGITIVTNTVNVAMELSNRRDIDVIVTGGHLRGNWFTLVGPLANAAADAIFADIMFIGVDGIHAAQGLTCSNSAEAELLRKLVHHSHRKVVVADRSKLGTVSNFLLCSTSEINSLITDSGATEQEIESFQRLGIDVTRT